jgi:isocitrate lyase
MDDSRELARSWRTQDRWQSITRPYGAEDVVRLRGSVSVDYTLARIGAERLWELLQKEPLVRTLGAMTGNQAVQLVQAGLKAIYISGWQVASDANYAGHTYPDQSLYPADSVPGLVRRINNALMRADQITHAEGKGESMPYWFAPIVADGEAGFGGNLNAFELAKAMIEAGAAGIHFEDQLSSAKKCGHMGGKVLVPTKEAVQKLVAARFAADTMGVSTVIIARTDACSASLLTSDIDEYDHPFLTGERTSEGFYRVRNGLEQAIARALAYAPFADLVWCETASPNLKEAREFAEGVHSKYPGKLLAYNCSPSFNWKMHLDEKDIAVFQDELAKMGYRFQFVTLAGFHSLNYIMFDLAHGYREQGMSAYSRLQQREFDLQNEHGYRAIKHQSFVGAGYFDEVSRVISGGDTSTAALAGSTEQEQFTEPIPDSAKAEEHHKDKLKVKPLPSVPRFVENE